MEVVIVVDWKEVSVDVSVSQQHIDAWDVMDSLQETVELQEAAWAVPLQSEASVLCFKLADDMNGHVN